MTADEIKQLLRLSPHPEGGHFIQTYKAADHIPGQCLPPRYHAPRSAGTAVYYLLEPWTFSEMHRLKSDEIFHFYLGDPVEMLQLRPDGTAKTFIIGTELAKGMVPQLVVPQGVWQGSRLLAGGRFALLGCTVSPGFEFADYESGYREHLTRAFPSHRELIEALTRH